MEPNNGFLWPEEIYEAGNLEVKENRAPDGDKDALSKTPILLKPKKKSRRRKKKRNKKVVRVFKPSLEE